MISPTDLRAVSFDIGGTLVQTANGSVARELATLLEVDVQEVHRFLNNNAKRRRMSCRRLVEEISIEYRRVDAKSAVESALRRMRLAASAPILHEDTVPTLAELRVRGYGILFLTNIVGAIAPSSTHGLYQLADLVFSSCDTGFVKPELEAFALVERASGLSGRELLHVGDSLGVDIEGARAAGWQALHINRIDGNAPESISNLHELLSFLPARAISSAPHI